MADEGDLGSIAEQHFTKIALKHRVRFDGPSEKECINCGEEINEIRRTKLGGVKRCLECQEQFERDQARYR